MNESSRLEAIFFAALEHPVAQRAAYLAEACADDEDLRRRVEKMLAAQEQAGSFLESSPARAASGDPTFALPPPEQPGTQIGPYKLLQEIGEGGMGTVYMAEQQQPVRRKVALKIIKPGMDTRQVIARFEAERQALSLMDHPNIAKVLDAGTTSSGRPYFVMELVKGQPISQYCNEKRLTPRQRLEMLLPVCQAIQHAHQKGIIHRDIKPSNILVAEYDQQPVPKVIDFGVAKATSGALTEKTMFTGLGQIVGTLEYMSPEQAKVNQLDVDTRTDIYSLGVLLYELLTGSTPFDRKRLRSAAWDEMLRIIREEEPPKPSTRLSDSQDSLPSISAQRQMEPGRLTKLMRGELDWIVMKAMEKDRNRRYETVSAMAADLHHYLSDEPVVACPPTVAYRVQKFVRRNKISVLATTLSLLGLVAVTAASAVAAITFQGLADQNASLAKNLKTALGDVETNLKQVKEKEQLAQTHLALATTEQKRAEENLDLALKAMDAVYLDAIGRDKLLGQQEERQDGNGRNRPLPLTEQEKQLLRRGLEFYEQFAQRNAATPRAAAQSAQAFYRVGLLHAGNRDKVNAKKALQEAIGRFTPLTEQFPSDALLHEQLAESYMALGKMSDWLPNESDTFQKAARAFTRALELRSDAASLYMQRADVYTHLHQHDLAFADREQGVKLAPENAAWHLALAQAYNYCDEVSRRDFDKALQHALRAVELDPKNADCRIELADIYMSRFDDVEAALSHVNTAIQLAPRAGTPWRLRAQCRMHLGEYLAALQDFNEAIKRQDDDTWSFMHRGVLHARLGKLDEALADTTRSLELWPQNSHAFKERAAVYILQKQYQKALDDLEKHHALQPQYAYGYYHKARAEFGLGRYDDALRSLRTAREKHSDLYALVWIPMTLVAQCPSESFKDGLLKFADECVEQEPAARSYRAVIAFHIGEKEKARADMVALAKEKFVDYVGYYHLALLALADNNHEIYRSACRDMLSAFAESKKSQDLEFSVWTAAIAPQALDGYGLAIVLAQRNVDLSKGSPPSRRSLGAVLYRAGKFDEAIRELTSGVAATEQGAAKTSPAYPLFFLAMAQHQLGNLAEARENLERARELTKGELDDESDLAWNRKVTLELLLKEAEELIGSTEPANDATVTEPQKEPSR